MSIKLARGKTDKVIKKIVSALRAYEADHPKAQIELYRQNPVSVRIRIVDDDLAGVDKAERNHTVWKCFDDLSEEEQSDISMLLLLTPNETKRSSANIEFDNPVPSILS
jgi:hypothetical protein